MNLLVKETMGKALNILVWKTLILRKRRWLVTFLELVVPPLLFWMLVSFKTLFPEQNNTVIYDTHPDRYSNYVKYDVYNIAYTPSNSFTHSIMEKVTSKLDDFNVTVTLVSKANEDEVVLWLREIYLNETNNCTSYISFDDLSAGVGIVFVDSNDTTKLTYTIRTTKGNLLTSDNTLSGDQRGYGNYDYSGFTTIQAAIDQAYLSFVYNFTVPNTTFLEYLPGVEYAVLDLLTNFLPYIITLGFSLMMPSLLQGIVEEKSSGIKEMMKMTGLQPWLGWFHWAVYTLTVYLPVTHIVTALLVIDFGTGPAVEASFFPVWISFMLFTLAFIMFIFALSTFFSNGSIALVTSLIVWCTVSIALNAIFVKNADEFHLGIHLLTCLWPSVPLQWSITTINTFHKNNHPWTLSNIFDSAEGGGKVSVGLSVIMLCVDILLYSLITWYMDNICPGPYGTARPLTFMFGGFSKKKEEKEVLESPPTAHNNYESTPNNVRVGIGIQGLRKNFKNGVVVVNGVDLDVYEGQITALLGHNGAGKTTTMSILTGFLPPSSGKAMVNNKNIFENMDEFRSSLGWCPQDNLLFSFFTVLEHLIFFGMLKGLSRIKAEQEGIKLLQILRIDGKKNSTVSTISGGMKRKLCLAIALMGDPKVLMLDEPTSGLDPESRRYVWDLLLGFRGQRTTVVSTHLMEEADVLGDRIAILDHGYVTCYGTPMFLKRLYGTGYHVNIFKEEGASIAAISRVVNESVNNAEVTLLSSSRLRYNVKANQVPYFPILFAALEQWRHELGLTGLGIECTTLEDVFLKASDYGNNPDINGHAGNVYPMQKHKKVTGLRLIFLQLQALMYKRCLSQLRSWISTLMFIIIPVILSAYTIDKTMDVQFSLSQPKLLISPASFPGAHIAVETDNQTAGSVLQRLLTAETIVFESVPTGVLLEQYMVQKIKNNLLQYQREILAGFQFNKDGFLGGFSQYFIHTYPLVLNVVANTFLQLINPNSSITIYNHPIVFRDSEDVCESSQLSHGHTVLFSLHLTFFSAGLLVITLGCIGFPLQERVTGLRRLQLMTGLSPLLYWISLFLWDFLTYLLITALILGTVLIFQDDEIYTASGYMGILVLVLILFGVSGTSFAYFFSFLIKSSLKASVLFIILNIATGTVAAVFLTLLGYYYTEYDTFIFFFSFNPIFSATCALIHLFTVMYINGTCNQCGKNCETVGALYFLETGVKATHPDGINNFLIFLVFNAILYFSLVLLIEYGMVRKFWHLASKMWIKFEDETIEDDEDVLAEKEAVKSYQTTRGYVSNKSVLRVSELGKKYGRSTLGVRGLTFQVGRGECVGLLGANGAGKTSSFKVLTGKELPSSGDATILHISLGSSKSKFLARVGYCPQIDALGRQLTAREILRVFALLRGIPSPHCDSEASSWLTNMGLEECGDRQCGTYSGGNKRKLSTALAIIGQPDVVLLDEPTSGVDPVSRRRLWAVVGQCQKAGQAIVLTSHSLDECEALCSRLIILAGGRMKCIGPAHHLKLKFGQGYTIKVKLHSSRYLQSGLNSLKQDIAVHFRDSCLKDEHMGLLHYHVPDPNIWLSEIFTRMEKLKQEHQLIEEYTVSDTTLEEVFLTFARAQSKHN